MNNSFVYDKKAEYDEKKLLKNGMLTNAAMVLLGKEEFDKILNTWPLHGNNEELKGCFHIGIPYITVAERVLSKIRNLLSALKKDGVKKTDSDNKQTSHWVLVK